MAEEVEAPLVQSINTTKVFNYQKGDVSLNFPLNVDDSHQLRNFLALLKVAVKDIEETLVSMKS
jgi:hypothetical protein